MGLTEMRRRLLMAVLDSLEALTGEQLVTVVTQGEDDSLTPWTFMPDDQLLTDRLNGWMDNKVWNAPKSL